MNRVDYNYVFHAWRLEQNVYHLDDDILVEITFWQKVNELWFKLHEIIYGCSIHINILRPRQNGRHFADDIFKWIFLNENVWIPIKMSLKIVPQGPINNILTLVQIMAWRRPGDKPLSGPMMVRLPTHICVTRYQWVKSAVVQNIWPTIAYNLPVNRRVS